jgi:hypothetical protein
MQIHHAAIAAVALAVTSTATQAIIHEFNFALSGLQAVPSNDSVAVGSAQLLYDTETLTFDLDLMVYGIELSDLASEGPNGTPVHIHSAPAGVNGEMVIDLGFLGEFVNDGLGIRLTLDDAPFGGSFGSLESDPCLNQADLFAGNLYINICTESFTGGEIRGQVTPAPGALMLLAMATLFGYRGRSRRIMA